MGNRRFGRRAPAPSPVSRLKSVPHRWLSCPNHGLPIHVETRPNLYFIPMKTPLTEHIANSLNQVSMWTPPSAISKAKQLVKTTPCHFLAINVAQHHEVITEQDWQAVGANYARCGVPKDYNSSSIDSFCKIINNELDKVKNETLVCLVYCGCGLNRSGFCIAAYLTRHCNIILTNSLKMLDESSPRLIYLQKPLDVLSSTFQTSSLIHGAAPDWVKIDEKIGPIGDIPLPLEKFNAIKKVSKKPASSEEKIEILSILADATSVMAENSGKLGRFEKTSFEGKEFEFPSYNSTLWNNKSFELLRNKPFLMTFEPRGVRVFIIVNQESLVFLVDPHYNVWELKVRANCQVPAVACAYLVEEKKRCVLLTTDLYVLGKVNLCTTYSLTDRLAHLSHSFTSKLKFDSLDQQYLLSFVFRPMTKLVNASKLRKDLSNLFVKCDGISFHEIEGNPLESIFLPINPSFILQFDYNGNDKAILYARGENSHLEPVGVYIAKSPKYNGFDGRTNRFEYDKDKHVWIPIAVGHNDPPSTTEEVQTLLSFLQTNISYDNIFKELDKISINTD
ncbi:hypothetical protein TRFO_09546 [Tritrichomonas foetus]|uniref:Tyrosine specific protein phosphatases domain-containing protein n=1 Tax=Tritrichomonas foetus TaxID=1144522 RepID=A0A1J4JIB8_9EUKA|nr:hypothetical protein TRFO_09546 [Tritrichomonas foetus]|eukprot:OHS97269.1 hypothetical protein TRFO_09546 [Tritrichomonas foetus]